MGRAGIASCLPHTCFAADVLPSGDPQAEDMLGVLDLHFHQRHPEKILFQGPGFYFWVTTDYGKTFTAHSTPGEFTLGFWMELKLHPNVPDWLLAKVKRKDCLSDLSSAACAHDLFVSQVHYAHFLPHELTYFPILSGFKQACTCFSTQHTCPRCSTDGVQ